MFQAAEAQQIPAFIAKAHADPDSICQGQYSQLSVTIQGGPGPFTYSWSPASSLSNPTIPDPLATPLVTTMYRLTVQDQWLNTSTDSIWVFVGTIPPPPSPISGPVDICADSVCSYSVQQAPVATSYSWTVPAGAVILNGQNTPLIQLMWGNSGGTVSVIIGNECGTSIPSALQVSVSTIPLAPGAIEGPSHFCQYDTGSFYADTVSHAESYQWSVPAGAQILNGQGTNSVRVKWGNSAGEVSVYGINKCGNGIPAVKAVEIDSLPASAGTLAGPDTVCLGKGSYIYSIEPVHFALAYGWTLPQGAVITSGQHSNSITVEFGLSAQPGPVTAFGINLCGNGQAAIKQIAVKNCTGLTDDPRQLFTDPYPNPAVSFVEFELTGLPGKAEIILTDMLGNSYLTLNRKSDPNNRIVHIPVSDLPRGLYFLTVSTLQGTFTKKIILR